MADGEKQPRSLERRILQREVLKYGGTLAPANGYIQEDVIGCHSLTPQLSADPTLTGLAQLAALRMNCKHGFISLIDDKFQHVLAEATSSISPFDLSIHAPGDDLAVGVQTLDLEFGICPLTLAAFSKGTAHWINSNITYADEEKYVISDLLAEPRVKSAEVLENNDSLRFYAEVPLKNSHGMVLGSVSVIDGVPRSDPASIDVRALQDIALMVMDHFELIRIKEVSLRAERLMQGLGHFNMGKSSISQWIMNNSAQETDDDIGTLTQTPTRMADSMEYFTAEDVARNRSVAIAEPEPESLHSRPKHLGDHQEKSGPEPKLESLRVPHQEMRRPSEASRLNGYSNNNTPLATPIAARRPSIKPSKPSYEVAQSRVPSAIKEAFSRACNLIRESMDLDATCFLEISPSALLSTKERKGSTGSAWSFTTSSESRSNMPEPMSVASRAPPILREYVGARTTKLCGQLASSTNAESYTSGEPNRIDFASFPESSLVRLAKEFPTGHVFNFDKFGALVSGDESNLSKKRASMRQRLADLMVQHFPHAKSLIFMPLYDNETRHLYSGFFGWTTDANRVLVENEVVYVMGFANSIMCEVMRLETLAVEKAKTDFMSSMSHELRSPLHGILGATQLMQESELLPAQQELALMIDSCGRTLLDIMNNLLEHAKINNITNAKRLHVRQGEDGADDQKIRGLPNMDEGAIELVNLATLVEETVTSVAAGHAVRQHRTEQMSARKPTNSMVNSSNLKIDEFDASGRPLPPAVIISIPHRDNWLFETEAGSWRRIVMNLVGNALKYTQRGHIHASIYTTEQSNSSGIEGEAKSSVILTVEDTGQGISDSYLKNRLFTPFAQENSHSVGAGLGLSIVNRLVLALGGTIDIESEIDVGTKVTIAVPLTPIAKAHPSFVKSESLVAFDSLENIVRPSDRVCFVGFGSETDIASEDNTKLGKSIARRALTLRKLKESLTELINTWFGLSVIEDADEATVLMLEESYAKDLLDTNPSDSILSKRSILVNARDNAAPKAGEWPDHFGFLAAPIGPTKLARILTKVLQQDIVSNNNGSKRKRVDDDEDAEGDTNMTNGSQRVGVRNTSQSIKRTKLRTGTSSSSTAKTDSDDLTTANSERKPRVLLVEDNEINLRLLSSFMSKLKYPFATATNGQEAVDQFIASHEENDPFRHIFMDVTMPVMNGLTATRKIRAYERSLNIRDSNGDGTDMNVDRNVNTNVDSTVNSNVNMDTNDDNNNTTKPDHQPRHRAQIIALTGIGNVEVRNEAVASGMDRYLCKPVKLNHLEVYLKHGM